MTYDEKENLVRDRIKRLQSEKGFTENGLAAGDQPTQKRLNRQLSHGDIYIANGDIYIANGAGSTGKVTGAEKVTGKNATIIGQQSATLSEDFVRGLLAEKDKQIETLLALLAKK